MDRHKLGRFEVQRTNLKQYQKNVYKNNLTVTITIINGLWTHGLVERIISKQVGFNVSLHTKQITLETSPSRQLIAQVLTTELNS